MCDFQEILEDYVGGWGPYQWKYLIVFAFVTTMLAYVTYSPLMILFVPENYWCTPPPGKLKYFLNLYKIFHKCQSAFILYFLELSNLTLVESQSLYIPLNSSDSKCQMYDVDYAEVLEVTLHFQPVIKVLLRSSNINHFSIRFCLKPKYFLQLNLKFVKTIHQKQTIVDN